MALDIAHSKIEGNESKDISPILDKVELLSNEDAKQILDDERDGSEDTND